MFILPRKLINGGAPIRQKMKTIIEKDKKGICLAIPLNCSVLSLPFDIIFNTAKKPAKANVCGIKKNNNVFRAEGVEAEIRHGKIDKHNPELTVEIDVANCFRLHERMDIAGHKTLNKDIAIKIGSVPVI